MTMKINSGHHTHQQVNGKHANQRQPASADNNQATTSHQSDSLKLSASASLLSRAEDAMQQTPVVDMQKVNSLHKAIVTGQYQVNPDRVAEKLIHLEHQLG